MSAVPIDLNVRVHGNQTFVAIDDLLGVDVEVTETESGLITSGRIASIDEENGLVYLDVAWDRLHQPFTEGARCGHVCVTGRQCTNEFGHMSLHDYTGQWVSRDRGRAARDTPGLTHTASGAQTITRVFL